MAKTMHENGFSGPSPSFFDLVALGEVCARIVAPSVGMEAAQGYAQAAALHLNQTADHMHKAELAGQAARSYIIGTGEHFPETYLAHPNLPEKKQSAEIKPVGGGNRR